MNIPWSVVCKLKLSAMCLLSSLKANQINPKGSLEFVLKPAVDDITQLKEELKICE